MSNVKNFGLIGVGSDLQFGKAGTRLVNNAGTFNFKAANGSTDAALTAAGITSSGNVSLTTGNLSLNATGGVISIGSTNVLQRSSNGVAQISGTAGVVIPAGTTAQRGTGETGLVRVNTDIENANTVEFWDGDAWITLATGGSTGAIQAEIDAIEASLGAGINSNGTFNAAGFTGEGLGSVTSFTDAINTVANAAAAKDTLDEIFPSLANGNVIYSAGGVWTQAAPGATSGVQAYDAGLAALAAKTSTGIMVQTGADTYESRTLVEPAAGITISNADGISGNPTFALANDLAALEGLAGTGFAVRTGTDTWAERSITGSSGRITVTNGDGVASSPTIDLDTLTDAGTGTFLKFTRDTYGRVSGTTAVVTADITGLVDGTYVNVTGDSMSGTLTMTGGATVTGLPAPTNASDAANKAYVDAVAEGLHVHAPTQYVAASNLVATYNNGSSGVGATLTANSNGALSLDGGSPTVGQRIMVIAQSNNAHNGIYVVTATGDGSNPYVLTRASDFDTTTEVAGGDFVFNQEGTQYANTGWVQTETTTAIGTSPIIFQQFSGAGSYSAGIGLSLSGTTFNVNLGAGIFELPSNEVGIELFDSATGAIILTTTGTNRSTDSASRLHLLIPSGAGLTQDATGLYIPASGVTNSMLQNSSVTTDADSGTGTLSLGGTLNIVGDSAQGTQTSVSGGTFTVTALNASSSQKGVASFDATEFTVTSGNVVIGTIGNNKLANSTITFTGDTGSEAVALGESFDFNGDSTLITTAVSGNVVSFTLGTVDVAHGGTGQTTLLSNSLLIGNGTGAVVTDADLAFNTTNNTLTVGSGTIAGTAGGDLTITATATNADINLVPNGTGSVVIGPAGAGVITADSGQSLTITGNNTLVLQSTSGDIVMTLANNTTDKVSISGPSAADYATNLAANDLTNKQYVDDAIQAGAASGSIKAVKATVNLGATGTTNIGAALPAGATIVRVKVSVTSADTGTGTLSVGVTGDVARYMTTGENDTQTIGLYLAETYAVEAGSVQVIATVAGTAVSGSAVVFVEYQVA